jgi:hypothetical protein
MEEVLIKIQQTTTDMVIGGVGSQVLMEEKMDKNGAGLEHYPWDDLHRKPAF